MESYAADQLGVDSLQSSAELNEVLSAAFNLAAKLYLVRGFAAALAGPPDEDTIFADRVRGRFLDMNIGDGTPVVHEMRRIKDSDEQAAIGRSIEVTGEALDALARSLRPGVREHALEAEIDRVYRAHGGTHAFDPIVACGTNALKLHYTTNDGPVEAGQLLLVDTGVSIDEYKSDITRTLPVDAKFTPRQREVYEVVLRAQQEAIKLCRPGALIGDIHARSFEVIAEAGFGGHEYPHGIGHHIGLETHDVGDAHTALRSGAVMTIEPGIYLAEEQIGIRIEDDVLVTDDGPRVLSAAIPKTVEAVESWLARARG